ncbi:MAG TPA: fibronectin type III domain-containing protein [Spirochaetota bacterium]|nr:fibronectin type III domain-containing protein [Spirochaetota bacterium]HPS86854.1 fibronectin type III domain-containing protein [Spirochaetota bacterium]
MKFTMIRKSITAAAALIIFTAVSEMPLLAEAVFLKDGSIVDGTIVSDGATSVTIRTDGKKTKQIPRSDIMRILYTELKMGKIYIQKRDGKGIVAYMVDEDRASYTFRMELYSPEEFTLKRSDVLFMAEKNPSGLQVDGTVGTDRVTLTWLPPYDAVKKYNVYIKKSDKDKYELIDSSGSKSITLKNLSSNTKYFLIVTSVDSTNYESSPSNELKITTKNVPPEKPAGIIREMKGAKVTVKWSEVKDPDGKVKGYNVYNKDQKDKGKIATLKTPEYIVPDNVSVYKLEIAAVDDLDTESEKVRVLMPMQLVLSVAPAAFFLTGELGDMFDPGYGGAVNIGLRNFMFQNFETGISFSYITFTDKEEMNTDTLNFMAMTAYAGYHLWLGDWFSIFPFAKLGESYSKVKYTGTEGETDKTIIDPVAAAGLSLTAGTDNFIFSIGGDYGMIYESAGAKYFYEGFVSCGILVEL